MIEIRSADDPASLAAARTLVRAHILALSAVHDVVDAERVVAALPAPYTAPRGALWVAWDGEVAVGCLALQELAPDTAELKRMYVTPEARGRGVARRLTEHAIAVAAARGYARLRLGTLPTMGAAQELYASVGFRRIAPYRPVEFGETWFYERLLDEPGQCEADADFDPLSPEYLADPFTVLKSLPRAREIFYAPSIDYYVVTRYADIEAVFLDPDTYSAAPAQRPLAQLVPEATQILLGGGHAPQPSMVSLDPPAHTRLRSPTARAFTPRRVAQMEPRIRHTVDQLLNGIDPSEPFDLVATLTFPLPATIIFSFVGIPERDWPQLKEWCGHRAALAWGRPTPDEQVHHATHMAAYRSYLRDLVARKANDRDDDDFASALLAIHDEDPAALTHEEIGSILYSLTFAGHETTNYLIGNVVRRLLEDPRRWDAVVARPELIPGAVLETLRYDPSVPVWRRVTKRPATLGGTALPEGAKLFLWLAASGRDASVFPEPERFDMQRANASKALAFGKGIHYCLGAALGKLETEISLEMLTRRFPRLRLVEGQQLSFHANISFRGPEALWVRAAH
jgi:hypothetical protein